MPSPATVEAWKVTYAVDLLIPNPDPALKPGMTASVTISSTDIPDALMLPLSAVNGEGDQATVSVVTGQDETGFPTTEERHVTVLANNGTMAAVEGDVAEGDEVVIGMMQGDSGSYDDSALRTRPQARRLKMASPVIHAEKVCRIYSSAAGLQRPALRGVSLDVERGEFLAIMGPSGSGKSTLMSILGCLDRPTSGQYLLEGIDVSKLTDDELAHGAWTRLGFVFQSFNLLPRATVLRNVMLPLVYSRGSTAYRELRAWQALVEVGLSGEPLHPPLERALRRTDATRGHRPCAGERPCAHPCRRAHGKPRLRHRRAGHAHVQAHAGARKDRGSHHARP